MGSPSYTFQRNQNTVSAGCRGAAASPQSSPWVAGEPLFQHLKHLILFLHPLPSSVMTGSAGLILSCIFTPLSQLQLPCDFSPPSIRYPSGTTTITDVLSLGQQWVYLGSVGHWRRLLASSHRSLSATTTLLHEHNKDQLS